MNVASISSVTPPAPAPAARGQHPTGAALRAAGPDAQRAAVAAQFEAILVRQLLGKTMSSMLGGAESGAAGSVYGDMLTDTVAQQLTAGPGLGLGRLLEQQLAPRAPKLNPTLNAGSAQLTPSPIARRS